jgi:hypothetical protein
MWGNPMRDILFSFRRLNISSRNTISSKRKLLTSTQNHPHNLLSWKTCQRSCTACTALLNNTLEIVPHKNCTDNTRNCPNHQQKTPKNCLDLHATMLLRISCPLCCTDPYNTTCLSAVSHNTSSQKIPWDLCPLSLGKSAQPAALNLLFKLTQKISLNFLLIVLHTTLGILL